ncbi:hypothetical protein [Nonomuraea sp. NPDC048916]|uniref:hypothetical protein n=1 Tax=Nonomuraea sp. NPDC048916 TaxID=3154232 RepID=UPI0033EC0551
MTSHLSQNQITSSGHERRGTVRLQRVSSVQDGARLVERKEADAVFVIPPGFSSAAGLEVIGGAHAPIAVQVAREMGQAFAMERQSIRPVMLAASRGLPMDEERDRRLAQRAQEVAAPLSLVSDTPAPRRQLDTATCHAAGMAIFFLFGVASVFEERRSQVPARLLAAAISRAALLGGKALSGILVGLVIPAGYDATLRAGTRDARAIVAGEAAGRLAIALVQSLLIMLGWAVLFGVDRVTRSAPPRW